jgi:hypothetical protein
MGRDWIDEGLRHEPEREAQERLDSEQHHHNMSVIKEKGPDFMHRLVMEVRDVIEEYRCKAPGSNDEVDFEELPHEGFCITKIRLPRVSLECRPDYEAHLLCCNMTRTDGRESEPTERMFNLSLTLDESDNVQLRQGSRIFRTVDEAAECILKPVLFPLVDRRPPI